MFVKFLGTGDPAERECEVFGQTFPIGEPVEVEGEAASRLSKNPTFEVAEAPRRGRRSAEAGEE